MTTNAQHTPGPWTALGRDVFADGSPASRVAACDDSQDARLIAAAPEMLAELQALSQALDENMDGQMAYLDGFADRLDALLARIHNLKGDTP